MSGQPEDQEFRLTPIHQSEELQRLQVQHDAYEQSLTDEEREARMDRLVAWLKEQEAGDE